MINRLSTWLNERPMLLFILETVTLLLAFIAVFYFIYVMGEL